MSYGPSFKGDIISKALVERPADNRAPIPQTLTEIVENVIRGVAMIAAEGVPTDREMKSLQIAIEILKTSPQVAEALGRQNPFTPAVVSELEETSTQRQTIARLRTIYAKAQLPASSTVELESESEDEEEPATARKSKRK